LVVKKELLANKNKKWTKVIRKTSEFFVELWIEL
jgi:hypothetical protein